MIPGQLITYIGWFPTGSTLKCSCRDLSTIGCNFVADICNTYTFMLAKFIKKRSL
jgi:hypothetical protein